MTEAASSPAAPGTTRVAVHTSPQDLPAAAWDALLDASGAATPFMRHAYLTALHDSGSAVAKTGWAPHFLAVEREGRLVAACALYLKSHSYGEYVFDWAWADAYQRAGHRYYPKLLVAAPFTPVSGSRLLAVDEEARRTLLLGLEALAEQQGYSSAHLLFIDDADRRAAEAQGWMLRSTVQFHWHNRSPVPYPDFEAFVADLHRDKRRKLHQERRYVREAGVVFEALEGAQIGAEDWDFFYRCYTSTYHAHHSTPYLTRDFFARMARTLPEHWLLFIARRGGERVAASLVAIDRARGHAWGRYWGATESIRCLHFEACYYQPLAWCVAQGFQRFEGGAQGEHKMARGLMPVRTASAHWLSHPAFADAVARFLEREGEGVAAYVDELEDRSPFRRAGAGAGGADDAA
jgi:predicted N-acyltransferase